MKITRMTTRITKDEFIEAYTQPGSSLAFSSPYPAFKQFKGEIPLSKIKNWMHGLDSYTLHKQAKSARPRNPTYSYFKRYQFQIDMCELTESVSSANDDYRYLLTAIDIFTRYTFVEPLKNKKASTFLEGFKRIAERALTLPQRILADRGAEIKNKSFADYCRQNKIKLLHSDNYIHAQFVERFNRTLKTLMY